jgi:membrane fusion protein, heavy metal efflux system
MKNTNRMLIAGLACIAVLAGGIWFIGHAINGGHADAAAVTEKAEQAPAGKKQEGAPVPAAELFTRKCEHNIPQYTCDECRYQLGLVKVVPALMRDKGGPLATDETVVKKMASCIEVSGEIRLNGNRESHISPSIPGVISAMKVDAGAHVSKGDVLFEIESTELGQAIGEYRKDFALADLSKRTYERKQSLFEQKIASEAELIDSRMSYEQLKTDFEAAKHTLYVMGLDAKEVASLSLGENRESVGKLPCRAPMSGIVVDKLAAPGERVDPGKDVMLLADLSVVWACLNIYEQDLAPILAASKKGAVPVEITTAAFPGEIFYGKIDIVGSVMNENTRTVSVRVPLNNPDGRLHPGMFCHARIAAGQTEEALAVPRDAVLNDEGKAFVFRQVKDEYYLRVPVKVGREYLDELEILNGLKTGDRVVTRGAFMLKSDVLREKMGAGCAD